MRVEIINKILKSIKLLIKNPKRFFKNIYRSLLPLPMEYKIWNKMNLREWFTYHQKYIVFDRCSWMGTPAFKNPLDAWIYQEIIYEVSPDVIIEIGSAGRNYSLLC